jgi:hypothetical protein
VKRLAAALVAAATLTIPAAADASPANCTTAYNPYTEWARCTRGTGHYRVVGKMVKGSSYLTRNGPWVGIGATSLVSVPTGYIPYFVGLQFAA